MALHVFTRFASYPSILRTLRTYLQPLCPSFSSHPVEWHFHKRVFHSDSSVHMPGCQPVCHSGLAASFVSDMLQFSRGSKTGFIRCQLEQVAVHLPSSSVDDVTSFAGLLSSALLFQESAAYCSTVGGSAMVLSSAALVPFYSP